VSVAEVPETQVDTKEETKPLRLSGSQPFTQQPGVYIMIGERTNVAGSPRFAKLVKEGKFEEAVSVARQQVENGANVLDICMDEGMIDGVAAMSRYLQLLASEPEVAKLPFMGSDRGRAQMPAGQGHRQFDLPQRGGREVSSKRCDGAEIWCGGRGDGFR
jgi:cobalamin-dependent methionine synthase I